MLPLPRAAIKVSATKSLLSLFAIIAHCTFVNLPRRVPEYTLYILQGARAISKRTQQQQFDENENVCNDCNSWTKSIIEKVGRDEVTDSVDRSFGPRMHCGDRCVTISFDCIIIDSSAADLQHAKMIRLDDSVY